MGNEEKLLELLRRAHAVVGEGLIENGLDESAQDLHNEIGAVQWFGNSLIVEHRFAWGLGQGMKDAGLVLEVA